MLSHSTEKAYSLDITGLKQRGVELSKAVQEAVRSTQMVIVRAYPNKIVMTRKQYNDLTKRPELLSNNYAGQEFYLYRTKYNIMEVEISER